MNEQEKRRAYLTQCSTACNKCNCKISERFGTNWHDTPECLTCENNPYKTTLCKELKP